MIIFWKPATPEWVGYINIDDKWWQVRYATSELEEVSSMEYLRPDDDHIPCTASELAAYHSDYPETVKSIWRLVEEHDGCRCWVDNDPFFYVYAGDSGCYFYPTSSEISTQSCAKEEDRQKYRYHRISLDEVLSAVKYNAPVTAQILEFVGRKPEPEESPKDDLSEIIDIETAIEKRMRLESTIKELQDELRAVSQSLEFRSKGGVPLARITDDGSLDIEALIYQSQLPEFIAWLRTQVKGES